MSARSGIAALARETSGQMAVELTVVVPVAIVVALIGVNLMRFVSLCALFDRASLDAVVSQGIAPAGEQAEVTSVEAVESSIERTMGDRSVSVTVSVEPLGGTSGETLVIAPNLTRYVCAFEMRPWPSSVVLAGVSMQAPALLRHERALVVDRYRPGVVV